MAQVARRYAMNANLIFKWLKDPRYVPDDLASDAPVFLPVEISPSGPAGRDLMVLPELATPSAFRQLMMCM